MLHALLPETPRSWRCCVYNRLAGANFRAGNLSEAARCWQVSLKLVGELGTPSLQAGVVTMLGAIAMFQGNYDCAEQLLGRSCELARRCGSMNMLVDALNIAGETAWYRGDVAMAEARWTDVLGLAQLHTGPWDAAIMHYWLSTTACTAGDFDRAEAFCQKCDEGFPQGNVYASGLVKQARARIALFRGDARRAAVLHQQSLHDLHLIRENIGMLRALEGLAWAWAAMGSYEKAAQLLGALAVERERSGMILPPVEQPHHERARADALDGLGKEAFMAAWAAGAALTLEEAVTMALTEESSTRMGNEHLEERAESGDRRYYDTALRRVDGVEPGECDYP
jgi:ATP/maltotriose-dependent transcriptional regulator MalT